VLQNLNKAPTSLNAEYYEQRATPGGLLIAEASQVLQQGQGYPSTPGIFSQEQVEGWKQVTERVHAKKGLIFLQLWHVGRVSLPYYQPENKPPVSSSDIPYPGRILTPEGPVKATAPRSLSKSEIKDVIEAYRVAAVNAKKAGFDGVELHAANGYLIEQFFNNQVNLRTDEYGGAVENRARLCFEILDAIIPVWGEKRVGIRLSPHEGNGVNGVKDSDPEAIYTFVLEQLSVRYADKLAYVHIIETSRPFGTDKSFAEEGGFKMIEKYAPLYKGPVIAASGFTPNAATKFVEAGCADAVAFGRFFISTPDLPERIRQGANPNNYTRKTFYTKGTKDVSDKALRIGYTDYPTLANAKTENLFDLSKL